MYAEQCTSSIKSSKIVLKSNIHSPPPTPPTSQFPPCVWVGGLHNKPCVNVSVSSHQCDETQERRKSHSLSVLFFASFFFSCLSLLLHPERTIFVESACVLFFFIVFCRIEEYGSLDLFYLLD